MTEKDAPVISYDLSNGHLRALGMADRGQALIIVHDELDELRRGMNTQIYTLDLSDLRAPTSPLRIPAPRRPPTTMATP